MVSVVLHLLEADGSRGVDCYTGVRPEDVASLVASYGVRVTRFAVFREV